MKYGRNVSEYISRSNPLYYLWRIWQTRAKLLDVRPDPSPNQNTLIRRVISILDRPNNTNLDFYHSYSVSLHNHLYSPESPAHSVPPLNQCSTSQYNSRFLNGSRSSAHAIS